MGPSGCGKSTILRTLNRMHETVPGAFVDGQVHFNGRNIYLPEIDPVDIRATIGMVFQKPNPFPKSIFDNIAYGPRILGLTRSRSELEGRIEGALKKVGLWEEVSDRLKESALGLSGGQQQRLIIARAHRCRSQSNIAGRNHAQRLILQQRRALKTSSVSCAPSIALSSSPILWRRRAVSLMTLLSSTMAN